MKPLQNRNYKTESREYEIQGIEKNTIQYLMKERNYTTNLKKDDSNIYELPSNI